MKFRLIISALALLLSFTAHADNLVFVSKDFPADKSPVAKVLLNQRGQPYLLALSTYDKNSDRMTFSFWEAVIKILKTQPLTYVTERGSSFQSFGNEMMLVKDGEETEYHLLRKESAPSNGGEGTCPYPIHCH